MIGEVARDFGLYTKITGGQRIDLFGARVEQLPAIWRRLVDAGFESGHAYGKALRTVKSCVGSTWCRYGVQDSVGAGDRAGAALPGPALAAQAQGRRSPAAPASAPRRRARTSASSPPRTAGTSTSAATAASGRGTPTCCSTDVDTRDADPHHRPVPDVLHPHRRPAAAHRQLARVARRRPRPPAGGHRRRLARHLRRARRGDGAARRAATRTSGRRSSTTRSGCAASCPSSTRPDTPDPSIAFVSERGQPRPAAFPSRAAAAGRPPGAGGGPMTSAAAGRPWTAVCRYRRPAARARRRGAGRRRAGGALPHLRRRAVRDRQPGSRSPARTCSSRGIVGSRGEIADGRLAAAQAGLRPAHRGLPRRRDGRRVAVYRRAGARRRGGGDGRVRTA